MTTMSHHILPAELDDLVARFEVRRTDAPTSEVERASLLAQPRFGTVFTDHMARVTWRAADGWTGRRVEPYGPLQLDPATAVLHYAQEIFEGMKAYKHADGSIWTFRPEQNARRYARSAHRLALPELAEEDFLASIAALVRTDVAWVPDGEDSSLYLRPFMFASESFLGVRPALEVEHLVIASPVGPYFPGGVRPVSIYLSEKYHRAGPPGGTGDAKFGGNYAASLLPQMEAQQRGFDQVCFLDGAESTYLEELGGMNIFLVMADGTVHTPELGSILEGITRKSIIQLARDRGHEVVERRIPARELVSGLESGQVKEFFACGTAAVVTPIGRLASSDFDVQVGGGEPGELTMALRAELTDIQYGRSEDRHGWMTRLA
ncbi:branched-chain amino acid aminotransferase [Myceligenerans xiligouense]|uniref:Branched-chain-amino-acid aminotransferase n=1 Tax=Myceligenerans xiligouense TaxID=253184 RepID=A0A3N4YP83_9MICO|nr:branched-chain amino acid aminotransferase [Myceligenerans xiligouense]RPF20290.1 branched chain amino acid aminotransferase [Myceligenerans xiligouense]